MRESERATAARETVERRIGENGRRVALGWSRRSSRSKWWKEEENPKLS